MTSKNIPRLSISASRSAACFRQSGVSRTRNLVSSSCCLSASSAASAPAALVHHGESVVRERLIIHRGLRKKPPLSRGAEIGSRNDAMARVSIVGPIGVAEKNGRRLSAIIRAVIKIIDGAVVAAVGNPNDAINWRACAHLSRNIGPTVVGLRWPGKGHGGRRQSGSGDQSQCVSHVQTLP